MRDKFILAIIAVIVFAYFFPQAASGGGILSLERISGIGISLIFFFYGLRLAPEKLRAGLKNWRLHLLIQSSTFLLFPLLVLPFYALAHSDHQQLLWLAVFFLAVMPSTVSSSVMMVGIAKGNIPAAIFNASISGIIGIVVTPLWLGIFTVSVGGSGDLSSVYFNLCLEIIFPVVLGIVLQRWWGEFARLHEKKLALFDKAVILSIIYRSFAHSFEERIFSNVSIGDLAILSAAVLGLFLAVYLFIGQFAGYLQFDREDTIAAQFCGTKKSLVHGSVFLKVIFGASPAAGMIIVPLMIFHALQILIISIIAGQLGRSSGLTK